MRGEIDSFYLHPPTTLEQAMTRFRICIFVGTASLQLLSRAISLLTREAAIEEI